MGEYVRMSGKGGIAGGTASGAVISILMWVQEFFDIHPLNWLMMLIMFAIIGVIVGIILGTFGGLVGGFLFRKNKGARIGGFVLTVATFLYLHLFVPDWIKIFGQ